MNIRSVEREMKKMYWHETSFGDWLRRVDAKHWLLLHNYHKSACIQIFHDNGWSVGVEFFETIDSIHTYRDNRPENIFLGYVNSDIAFYLINRWWKEHIDDLEK